MKGPVTTILFGRKKWGTRLTNSLVGHRDVRVGNFETISTRCGIFSCRHTWGPVRDPQSTALKKMLSNA